MGHLFKKKILKQILIGLTRNNLENPATKSQDRDNIIKCKTKQIRQTDSQQTMYARIIF
jgi:hypothetical protein